MKWITEWIDGVLIYIGNLKNPFKRYKPKLYDVVVFNNCIVGIVERIYEKYGDVEIRIEHSYYPQNIGQLHFASIDLCKLVWRKK